MFYLTPLNLTYVHTYTLRTYVYVSTMYKHSVQSGANDKREVHIVRMYGFTYVLYLCHTYVGTYLYCMM